jgi:hypothetical protein
LLHIELAAGAPRRQLRHFTETLFRELELSLKRLDGRVVRRWVDAEENIARLQRRVCRNGHLDHLARERGHDLHRIAQHGDGPRRRAPSHRNGEQDEHDDRRELPERIQRNEAQPNEQREDRDVHPEQDGHHGAVSRRAGTST